MSGEVMKEDGSKVMASILGLLEKRLYFTSV